MIKDLYKFPKLPTACSLLVTEQCNLRCKYCFETHNNRFMNWETAKNAIDFLFENAIKSGCNEGVNITYFGGEPTLNPDLIIQCIEYGNYMSQETGIDFSSSIITNCLALPDNLYNYLKENINNIKFSAQLSIDGVKEVQDMYRVTPNGKPSYDIVIKTLEKWKDIFRREDGSISTLLHIHGCINKQTMPYLYKNFIHFIEELGIDSVWFLPIAEEDWDSSDVLLYKQETEKMLNYIIEKAKTDKSYLTRHAPFDRYKYDNCHPTKLCGAGVTYCSITAEGDVYPCHQYYFNDPHKETCIGNVYSKNIDDNLRRFFLEYDAKDLTCDKNCDNYHCYRCLAANFTNNKNSLIQTRKFYCGFMSIDRQNQLKLREVEQEMGLLNNKVYNCSSHTTDVHNGCDVVSTMDENGNKIYLESTYKENSCKCGGDSCGGSDNSPEIIQALAEAVLSIGENMKELIDKVEDIKKKVE